jgi:hypothetical protein
VRSSTDAGRTWNNTLITARNFSPIIADDELVNPVYMGDYDGVAAVTLGYRDDFLGAYGNSAAGNPDVQDLEAFRGTR